MPWVKLDDRFPSHRKVALLSDRAFRLYVSALCWSSENLTEGRIADRELPVISRIRAPKTVAKELQTAGLWDRVEDGWVIHDYLVYNPDRSKVKAERAANAARQQAYRDRQKAQRDAEPDASNDGSNATRNGVTGQPENAHDDSNATRTRHDGDTNPRESDPTKRESSQVSEIRNGVSNDTPSRPQSPLPPTEVEQASYEQHELLPTVGPQPRIPAACRPLVDTLTSEQMIVGWGDDTNWLIIEALIKRCGIPMLVDHARTQWQRARDRPQAANYFIPGWRTLPDRPDASARPAQTGPPAGPPTANQRRRDLFDTAAAKLAGVPK